MRQVEIFRLIAVVITILYLSFVIKEVFITKRKTYMSSKDSLYFFFWGVCMNLIYQLIGSIFFIFVIKQIVKNDKEK